MRVVQAFPAHPLNGCAIVGRPADVVVPAFADEAGADEVLGGSGHAAAPACAGANISAGA